MRLLALVRSAGAVDLKNVRRDELLAGVAAAPVVLALLYRLGLPPLAALLERELGFDLAPYHPLLASFFVLLAPSMVGMIAGFLLLDERDQGVFDALRVTPLPLGGYLLYRTAAPVLVGGAVTVAAYPLAGIAPLALADLVAIAFVAALTGPLTALFLAAFAENKVAGFALVKVLNTISMVPVAAWFLDPPWQLAAGIVPTFWPMKMTWLAAAGAGYAPFVPAALAAYGAATLLLLRRFQARCFG
jgi:fluoroquinolone transport system permease protein